MSGYILLSDEGNNSSNTEELSEEIYEIIKEYESVEKEVREDLNRNNSNDALSQRNDYYSGLVEQYLNFREKFKDIKPVLEDNKPMELGHESDKLQSILASLSEKYKKFAKHREQMKIISESLNKIELFCKSSNCVLNEQNSIHETFKKMASTTEMSGKIFKMRLERLLL